MKKTISVLVAVIMLICSFSLPSKAVDSGNFSYEVVNDEVVITKYIGSNQTSVIVPSTVNNMPVVTIGDGAFKDNKELKTVIVSEGIEDVGASAFENCTSLATITLPTTINHIGEKAIYNTAYYNNTKNWKNKDTPTLSGGTNVMIPWEDIAAKDLEYLYLGKNLIKISFSGSYYVKDGTLVIADGAFAGCGAENVMMSKSLKTIGANAFKDCRSLQEVVLHENIEVIGDSAFAGCISLDKITLSDKYIEMNSNVFYNTGIYNNAENWKNEVLYFGETLINTRDSNNIIDIKDGTKYIIGNSLRENDVFIPKTVTHISEEAFTNSTESIIFGYSDTIAQKYANEHDITFVEIDKVVKGDINYDGNINTDDYEILCEIATNQREPNVVEKLLGDMDEDGAVDGFDAIILDLIINEMPPSQIKGDVNGDNKVNVEDYNLLVKIVSTSVRITDNYMFRRADMNEDGAVDSFDAVYLDLALNGIVALI